MGEQVSRSSPHERSDMRDQEPPDIAALIRYVLRLLKPRGR